MKADPPRPGGVKPPILDPADIPDDPAADTIRAVKVRRNGTVYARGTYFYIDKHLAGRTARTIHKLDRLLVFGEQGAMLAERLWPLPGTTYVGNDKSRGRRPATRTPEEVSPLS